MRDEGREELGPGGGGAGGLDPGAEGGGVVGLDSWVLGKECLEDCLLVVVGESSVALPQVPRLRCACLCPLWWR